MDRWCALVLAAGRSTRAGEPKHLREFHGRPWMFHLSDVWRACGADEVLLVLGEDAPVPPLSTSALIILRNSRWELGPLHSAQLGIAEAQHLGMDAVLLSPVDVPPPRPSLVKALLPLRNRPRRPVYNGAGGHPVAIPSAVFSAILRADPATIALNTLLRTLDLEDHPVEYPAVLENLNDPGAWARWKEAQA